MTASSPVFPEKDQAILARAANTATACAREQSDERISDRIATIKASNTENPFALRRDA